MMKAQLRQQVYRTKGKLNTICVGFDLDTMEGYKNRKRVNHLIPHSIFILIAFMNSQWILIIR